MIGALIRFSVSQRLLVFFGVAMLIGAGVYSLRTLPIGDPRPAYPRAPGHAAPGIVAVPAGTWVRDACHALPAAEVCDRLRDRRWALNTRYNSAMQGERAQITLEQRGIDARLDSECGGR